MTRGESGQALTLALLALGAGILVIVPFLNFISGGLVAGRGHHSVVIDRYSTDAGVEWALWRVKMRPDITDSPVYTSTPLQPFPQTINGAPFPLTEIRLVSSTGDTEVLQPPWQPAGTNWVDYPFIAKAPGKVTVVVELPQIATVQFRFNGDFRNFSKPPYETTYDIPSAGSWVMQVRTPNYWGKGAIRLILTYAGSRVYDIRSSAKECVTTVRCAVSSDGRITINSWSVY